MSLVVYNTLSGKKEKFESIEPKVVKMYSCGPTVYTYAHIGNLRTYVFMDLIRRVLAYNGYKLTGVINITDVGHLLSDADEGEDKMVKASREQKKQPLEIAQEITKVFFDDLDKLNIGKPEVIAKATEHIQDMIDYVQELEQGGFAYETSDGIYFDIAKFPGYGKLSGLNLDEQIAGARVDVNVEKRHPADFALWKKAEPNHIMQWHSPWGMGYPGWHIECSAMGQKYLGQVFDIHTGGVDHIPIHHENEIAQNEARIGKKSVNYWMHGEFMLVDGGKMSKSLGNTYTIKDLEQRGFDGLDFRFFCLNAQYRKKLNFTFEALKAAKVSRERLAAQLLEHKDALALTSAELLQDYKEKFLAAINDDLNIPLALGILFTMLKEPKSKDIYKLALYMDGVFGLRLDKISKAESQDEQIPKEVLKLAEVRFEAKKEQNFALADSLRSQIKELGYAVMDSKDGFKLVKL